MNFLNLISPQNLKGTFLWNTCFDLNFFLLFRLNLKNDTIYDELKKANQIHQKLSLKLPTITTVLKANDYLPSSQSIPFSIYFVFLLFKMPVIFRGSAIDDTKKQRLNEALDFFESMLKGRTWAAINNFTIADLTLTVTIAQLEMIEFDLEPYTRVSTWLKRCKDYLSQHGYDVRIKI